MLDDSVLALHSLGEVECPGSIADSEFLSPAEILENLGIAAERLGRDTAFIETGSAHRTVGDDGNLNASGCGCHSGLIAAGSCSDYCNFHCIKILKNAANKKSAALNC